MSRTRSHSVRLDDDPRTPRKFRQKSGVNLIHEDKWYGFNVAEKMPIRETVDPAGVEFTGLPPGVIEYRGLTEAELGDNEVTNRVLKTTGDAATERAVSNAALRTNSVDPRTIAPSAVEATAHPIRNVAGGLGNVRALPTGVKVDLDNVVGELGTANIPILGADKLPNIGNLNGQLPGNQISGQVPAANLPNVGALNGQLPGTQISGTIPATNLPGLNNLSGNLDGGKLQKKSVPSSAIHDVHGSKIVGKNSIPWGNIKVSGVVFSPRLNSEINAVKRWVTNNFARRSHNHGP